jgi:EAL domain-containing protein (putative c-di-GMP-specific phosphodiesterase class I)
MNSMFDEDRNFEPFTTDDFESTPRIVPFRCEEDAGPGGEPFAPDEDLLELFDAFGAEKTNISNYASRRLSVLLIDDDPAFAQTCARFLEAAGHIVSIAETGQTAIQMAVDRRFDAVVSDINLPDGNGLQILQEIRLQDATLPFVLVTGDPQLDTARAAVEVGALSSLCKPVSAMQLESVIERAFRARQTADFVKVASRRGDELRETRERFERALSGLWMAFQPIVSWSNKGMAGYEALLRSTEPTISTPLEMLRMAGEINQLVPLGQRIRRHVAAVMLAREEVPTVFVNLHALELLDEELYNPSAPLSAVANHVFFEITEQTALNDREDFVARMKRLRAMGYRIAVSDIAGAGSGLGSLVLLEPDAVKLDMSVLRQIESPKVRGRLIRAVVSLCRDLCIPLIAEGVESEADRDAFLAERGNLMQGFLFAHPEFPFPTPQF